MAAVIVPGSCEMAVPQDCSSSCSPCLINVITARVAERLTGKVHLSVPFLFHGDYKSVQLLTKYPLGLKAQQ